MAAGFLQIFGIGKCVKTASGDGTPAEDRKSTRLNSSHPSISYAVFCLKKKISRVPGTRGCRAGLSGLGKGRRGLARVIDSDKADDAATEEPDSARRDAPGDRNRDGLQS